MEILSYIFLMSVPIFLLLLAGTFIVHIFFLIPYVPTKQRVVKKMVEMARLKKNDTVYDLGCGDGRILIAAEKEHRVRGVGFEIAPLIYLLVKIKKWLTRARFEVRFQNLFKVNLRKADVIFCYLLPEAMEKIAQKIKKECKKGTRIVSQTFHLPGFTPVKTLKKNKKTGMPSIYLYQV